MFEKLMPIASALPNGKVRIKRNFRWIPKHVLKDIESAEQAHRDQIAYDAVIIKREFYPTKSPEIIGLRKDATLCNGDAMIRNIHESDTKRSRRRVKINRKPEDKVSALEVGIMKMISAASNNQLNNRDFGLHRIGDPKVLSRIEQEIKDEIEHRRYKLRIAHLRLKLLDI